VAAFQKESTAASLKLQNQKPPITAAELENATDKEITETFRGLRTKFAREEKHRRDLLRNDQPMTAEAAIAALRGPEE
jgi:hypothetical protein